MRAALALVVLAATASAQAPDTTGVLAAPVGEIAAADSAALPRPSVAPFGPAPGRAVTPVPAVTASLSVARLVGGGPPTWLRCRVRCLPCSGTTSRRRGAWPA